MKRSVGLILLLLVAGAIVNVAVATGPLLLKLIFSPDRSGNWVERRATDEEREYLPQALPGVAFKQGDYRTTAVRRRAWEFQHVVFIPMGLMVREGPADRTGYEYSSACHVRSGLPLRSLEHVQTVRSNIRGTPAKELRIPVRPIWPGFALNTLFYAGILWLLFAAPFALRHRRRIKRGLCPACAYPVGDSEVCTECGARLQCDAEFQ